MTTKLFLINKLNTKLTVKSGYIEIPAGGFAPIHESDKEDPSVIWALTRDWAEVSETEPKGKAQAVNPVEIEVTKPYEGLTAEELKAEQEKEAAAKAAGAEAVATEETTPAKKKGK